MSAETGVIAIRVREARRMNRNPQAQPGPAQAPTRAVRGRFCNLLLGIYRSYICCILAIALLYYCEPEGASATLSCADGAGRRRDETQTAMREKQTTTTALALQCMRVSSRVDRSSSFLWMCRCAFIFVRMRRDRAFGRGTTRDAATDAHWRSRTAAPCGKFALPGACLRAQPEDTLP